MKEEIRILKEIIDNEDLDNYTIDDDECYLNGYVRKCLKKVLDEIERLNKDNGDITKLFAKEREETKRLHSIIKEAREYIDEHIKYECDNAFNGMQFYSYHLYDFNKNKLLEILDKVGAKE